MKVYLNKETFNLEICEEYWDYFLYVGYFQNSGVPVSFITGRSPDERGLIYIGEV